MLEPGSIALRSGLVSGERAAESRVQRECAASCAGRRGDAPGDLRCVAVPEGARR
jgi:hypothetical protein